jgi:glutamine synthetase
MFVEVLGEITIPQKMKDPVLEALEHAGIEPDFVHVGVGEVTIEVSQEVYEDALEVVDSVLLTGF